MLSWREKRIVRGGYEKAEKFFKPLELLRGLKKWLKAFGKENKDLAKRLKKVLGHDGRHSSAII